MEPRTDGEDARLESSGFGAVAWVGRSTPEVPRSREVAMRAVVFAATLLFGPAQLDASGIAAPRRFEPDECARRSLECERECDRMEGMSRLSCKTDCRMAESQCRNGARR